MDTDFEDECKDIVARREKLTEDLKNMPKQAQAPQAAKISNGTGQLNDSVSRRKTPKRRSSNWAKGVSRTTKRLRRHTEGSGQENGDEDANDGAEENGLEVEDEDSNQAGSSNGSNDGNETMVPTGGVRLDQSRMNQLLGELVKKTDGYTVRELEQVNTNVARVVSSFALQADRTQLPKEIKQQIDVLQKNAAA